MARQPAATHLNAEKERQKVANAEPAAARANLAGRAPGLRGGAQALNELEERSFGAGLLLQHRGGENLHQHVVALHVHLRVT